MLTFGKSEQTLLGGEGAPLRVTSQCTSSAFWGLTQPEAQIATPKSGRGGASTLMPPPRLALPSPAPGP